MKLFTKSLILKSFTLIELLIVIVIIGVLSTALIPRIKSIQTQARDTKRITDMIQIEAALKLHNDNYGYLPMTSNYGESNSGNRDYSSQSGFLTFLRTADIMDSMPVDPINDIVGDDASGYGYRYYCYLVGGAYSVPTARLGMRLERPKPNIKQTLGKDWVGGGVGSWTYAVFKVSECR